MSSRAVRTPGTSGFGVSAAARSVPDPIGYRLTEQDAPYERVRLVTYVPFLPDGRLVTVAGTLQTVDVVPVC